MTEEDVTVFMTSAIDFCPDEESMGTLSRLKACGRGANDFKVPPIALNLACRLWAWLSSGRLGTRKAEEL
jgi:hypothetical protein